MVSGVLYSLKVPNWSFNSSELPGRDIFLCCTNKSVVCTVHRSELKGSDSGQSRRRCLLYMYRSYGSQSAELNFRYTTLHCLNLTFDGRWSKHVFNVHRILHMLTWSSVETKNWHGIGQSFVAANKSNILNTGLMNVKLIWTKWSFRKEVITHQGPGDGCIFLDKRGSNSAAAPSFTCW